VVGGWFKQPHLAPVRLIKVRGWVRLYQCPQVQPVNTTRTHDKRLAADLPAKHLQHFPHWPVKQRPHYDKTKLEMLDIGELSFCVVVVVF